MITVQPIRYTSHADEWHRLAQKLGFVAAFPPSPEWSEFDGNGILAIHHATPGDAHDGVSDLHLLADDLDSLEARVRAAGFSVGRTMLADIGPMLTVAASSGATITISGGARPTSGPLAVQPIWYQPDLTEPRQILQTIGLQPRIASNTGGWIDFTADGGGQAALHHGDTVRFELSLAYTADLDGIAEHLTDAGFQAAVIDEAYNRTLRVTTPDGDQLSINGRRDDLYGYTRLNP